MAKDKKNKKGKKTGKGKKVNGGVGALKALAQNPMVADVVAAALVATAAALKDSKRARALASDAGDELATLTKAGAKSGEALWDMALQIGRSSLEAALGGGQAQAQAQAQGQGQGQGRTGRGEEEQRQEDIVRRQKARHEDVARLRAPPVSCAPLQPELAPGITTG